MQETFYQVHTPLSIALITDLHQTPGDAVLASLRANRPELICLAGDLVYGCLPKDRGLTKIEDAGVLPFLSACAELAPSFYSLGNHEWMLGEEDFALIAETGVELLDNRWIRRGDMAIGGLSCARNTKYRQFCTALHSGERYPYNGDRYPHAVPVTDWLAEMEAFDGYKLLLCHHPEYYPAYLSGRKLDLILSGHAHGGQIRLFGRGLYAPGQGLCPKYTSGVYDGRMVVSRGLSNNVIVPRLFNPTEIVYIH